MKPTCFDALFRRLLAPASPALLSCSDHHTLVLSGVAGLVGGALSMAVGELGSAACAPWCWQACSAADLRSLPPLPLPLGPPPAGEANSVSSQRDAEASDIEQERLEQLNGPEVCAWGLPVSPTPYQARAWCGALNHRPESSLASRTCRRHALPRTPSRCHACTAPPPSCATPTGARTRAARACTDLRGAGAAAAAGCEGWEAGSGGAVGWR